MTKPKPDVLVENHGSIFMFQPMTPAARAWIEEHVKPEPWQWYGGGLAVDPRYARDLADGMIADGLKVE